MAPRVTLCLFAWLVTRACAVQRFALEPENNSTFRFTCPVPGTKCYYPDDYEGVVNPGAAGVRAVNQGIFISSTPDEELVLRSCQKFDDDEPCIVLCSDSCTCFTDATTPCSTVATRQGDELTFVEETCDIYTLFFNEASGFQDNIASNQLQAEAGNCPSTTLSSFCGAGAGAPDREGDCDSNEILCCVAGRFTDGFGGLFQACSTYCTTALFPTPAAAPTPMATNSNPTTEGASPMQAPVVSPIAPSSASSVQLVLSMATALLAAIVMLSIGN